MNAYNLLKFIANKGAPHGLRNLYSPIIFIFGVGLIFSGLFASQKHNISLLKLLLTTGIGSIIVIQSIIIRNLVRLQEKYSQNKFLIYRGVVGTIVISLWISAIKTSIEFMIKYGGS